MVQLRLLQSRSTDATVQGTALLTLLLDTGRQRYSATPERGVTSSPAPPESLTYTPLGRKMLQCRFKGASTPALGSWLHSMKVSGPSEDISENASSVRRSLDNSRSAANSFDVPRDSSPTWVCLQAVA